MDFRGVMAIVFEITLFLTHPVDLTTILDIFQYFRCVDISTDKMVLHLNIYTYSTLEYQ